jgi:2-haloacid dehalogenase
MLLIFDVNETLLDLAPLDDLVGTALGAAKPGPGPRREWFDRMIRSALALTAAGEYAPFGALAGSALRDLGAERGLQVDDEQLTTLARGIRRLPAHPDARPALGALRAQGHRIVALTNSVLDVAHDQLNSSGLRELVDAVYSADAVRRLKPAREPYRMVLQREGSDSGIMVAAHDWDVIGAAAAGLDTIFVAREGRRPVSAAMAPGYNVPDLSGVAAIFDGAT